MLNKTSALLQTEQAKQSLDPSSNPKAQMLRSQHHQQRSREFVIICLTFASILLRDNPASIVESILSLGDSVLRYEAQNGRKLVELQSYARHVLSIAKARWPDYAALWPLYAEK